MVTVRTVERAVPLQTKPERSRPWPPLIVGGEWGRADGHLSAMPQCVGWKCLPLTRTCDHCHGRITDEFCATRCTRCYVRLHDNCVRGHYQQHHPTRPIPRGYDQFNRVVMPSGLDVSSVVDGCAHQCQGSADAGALGEQRGAVDGVQD